MTMSQTRPEKSLLLVCWIALNILIPVTVSLLLDLNDAVAAVGIIWQRNITLTLFVIMTGLQIFLAVRYRRFRFLFSLTVIFNVCALVLAGQMSFVTALPHLPFMIDQLLNLIRQSP